MNHHTIWVSPNFSQRKSHHHHHRHHHHHSTTFTPYLKKHACCTLVVQISCAEVEQCKDENSLYASERPYGFGHYRHTGTVLA